MASLKSGIASCLYNIIRCRTSKLVRYVITAKDLFETSIYALEVMLSNFKNHVPQEFHLLDLRPYVKPTSNRCMGPVFSHNAGDCCLITNMLFVKRLSLAQ